MITIFSENMAAWFYDFSKVSYFDGSLVYKNMINIFL